MIVRICRFTLFFPYKQNIREKLFELEKSFTDFQTPFTLVPLPADAPPEIPRIVAKTPHGHSTLLVNGNSIQLEIRYDANYNNDVTKCIEYMRERCRSVVSAIHILTDETESRSIYYAGISSDLVFDVGDGINDPVLYLNDKFLKCSTNLPVTESNLRMAMVLYDKYYVNVMLQVEQSFEGQPDERGSLARLKKANSKLIASLDINDRYAFNTIDNYYSSVENIEKIADIIETLANGKIQEFVEKGELVYE